MARAARLALGGDMTVRGFIEVGPDKHWRVIVAALFALGLTGVACPAGAATMLSDELAKLSASHGIEFRGLDKTTRAPAPEAPAEGEIRVRLKALLADYNAVLQPALAFLTSWQRLRTTSATPSRLPVKLWAAQTK
jgi:hypothetical protein